MLRFLFRADSGEGFGHGHSARVETLARAAKGLGHEVALVSRRNRGQRLAGDVFDAHVLLPPHSDAPDAGEVADAIDALTRADELQFESDIVIVDHYQLTASWERTARSRGKFVVALDDTPDRPHDADIVFEFVPEVAVREQSRSEPGALRIRGLEHLPVGQDFRMAPPDWSAQSRNILVSFGGSDPTGGTLIACEALVSIREAKPKHHVTADVVMAPAGRAADDVRRFVSQRPWIRIHNALPSLAPLVRRSHHVICAAGNTLVEAVAARRAPVSVIVADNQRILANHLAQTLRVRVFASPDAVDPATLADAVLQSWDDGGICAAGPIDTLGADRFIARVLEESGMSR